MTVLGPVRLRRPYWRCASCALGRYAADDRLGLDDRYSRAARRLICKAGASVAFAQAADWIQLSCGWAISDETVRQICLREAGRMAAWRDQPCPAERAAWAARDGAVEFQTDAAKVNTTEGWRDMKLGVVAVRPAGPPATPSDWDQRELPKPSRRLAFAAIEDCQTFGQRWWPWIDRLGLAARGPIHVLGDGAEWIWSQAEMQFPECEQILDIYHASEHIAQSARIRFGEQAPEIATSLAAGRSRLLTGGWSGLCAWIGDWLGPEPTATEQQAADALTTYFSNHRNRLDYAGRLAAGRPIGSGLVEGTAKQVIVKRLKQTSARWRAGHANRMGTLTCLAASSDWERYWASAA